MNIKLTPVPIWYTDKYVIEINCMHGDADAYTIEEFVCEDKEDFISTMVKAVTAPKSRTRNELEEYNIWCEETFPDTIPVDVTNCDFLASIETVAGYYYDAAGAKFKAELV